MLITCPVESTKYKDCVHLNPIVNFANVLSIVPGIHREYYGAEYPTIVFTMVGNSTLEWRFPSNMEQRAIRGPNNLYTTKNFAITDQRDACLKELLDNYGRVK